MRCSHCNHDNDDSKAFCTKCGARLGGRKCQQGHTIPEGMTECPYCPRPVRVATVVEQAPPPADGGRGKTYVVPPDELQRSGVQVGLHATPPRPVAPRQEPPPPPAPPAGRARTVFRDPNAPDVPPPPAPAQGGATVPPRPSASSETAPLLGFLVSFDLDPSGSYWPVRFGRTTIGTATECEVKLPAQGASGRHAEVMARAAQGTVKVWISDCNSTNGTVVNGEEIFTERPPLAHGDQITIAGVTLTVMILPRWIQG